MQPIRRILVAVKNPAARSLPAVNKAAQIAKGLNATHAVHESRAAVRRSCSGAGSIGVCATRSETSRREQLENSRRVSANTHDVDVAATGTIHRRGHRRKAQRVSADLVVAENHHSSKGGTGKHPARWLLAYTDWELLRTCPIPLLLVKNRKLYHRPRVLAAVDPAHALAKTGNLDRQILRAGAQLVHVAWRIHSLQSSSPAANDAPMPDDLIDPTCPYHWRAGACDVSDLVDGFE